MAFPIIDEAAWGVTRPVRIDTPRPPTPFPQPVSARPQDPPILPGVLLAPQDSTLGQYVVQDLLRHPIVQANPVLSDIVSRWSPDLPQPPTLGPSLLTITRPDEATPPPLYTRVPLRRQSDAEIARYMTSPVMQTRLAATGIQYDVSDDGRESDHWEHRLTYRRPNEGSSTGDGGCGVQ